MAKSELDKYEAAWLDKVCELLEADKKHQWAIGDELLKGECWFVKGISGKELHDMDDQANRAQQGAEDEHTPYKVSIGGHDPYAAVAKRSGYDRSSLQDFMRVSRVFPAGKRVMELSWSHHQACAAKWLTDDKREELLELALPTRNAMGTAMSVAKLRRLVNEQNTNEFDRAYANVSFKLPKAKADRLDKLAKKEKRTVGNLMEQAVDLLFGTITETKKKDKAA